MFNKIVDQSMVWFFSIMGRDYKVKDFIASLYYSGNFVFTFVCLFTYLLSGFPSRM